MVERWYVRWYESFGPEYNREPYVETTPRDIDFVEKEVGFDRGKRFLDIGCGTGRHSLELARRGYDVTGVDLSASMLDQGIQAAAREGLAVRFLQGDACSLRFSEGFDVALSLCEGAFSLMLTDEDDLSILANVRQALRPGGKLILETGNALFQIIRNLDDGSFDVEALRERFPLERSGPNGETIRVESTQRYYTCPELKLILRGLGFSEVRFYSGDFRHDSPVSREDFNMLVVATLPPDASLRPA